MRYNNERMMPIPQTFSVRDLQRNYRSVVDAAKRSQDAVVLINNSVPEAVVLDIKAYQQLIKDDYPWDVAFVKRVVEKARKEYREGKATVLKSWSDLDA